jgi:hypothetical protein
MSGFWLFNCLVDNCLYTLPFFNVCLFVWWCLMPLSLVLLCFHVYQSVKTVSLGFMFAVQWSKLTMCRCWNSGLISLKACWIWVCLTLFESYIQQPFNPSITIYYFIKKNWKGSPWIWLNCMVVGFTSTCVSVPITKVCEFVFCSWWSVPVTDSKLIQIIF